MPICVPPTLYISPSKLPGVLPNGAYEPPKSRAPIPRRNAAGVITRIGRTDQAANVLLLGLWSSGTRRSQCLKEHCTAVRGCRTPCLHGQESRQSLAHEET